MSDEEEKEVNYTKAYLEGEGFYAKRREAKRKEREREKTEQEKTVEETVAENQKLKSDLLTNINTFLLDVAISEKWWSQLRKAVESMVINSDAQTIILLLGRDEENEDVWRVEAIVSPIKAKGKRWIEVNFGDES